MARASSSYVLDSRFEHCSVLWIGERGGDKQKKRGKKTKGTIFDHLRSYFPSIDKNGQFPPQNCRISKPAPASHNVCIRRYSVRKPYMASFLSLSLSLSHSGTYVGTTTLFQSSGEMLSTDLSRILDLWKTLPLNTTEPIVTAVSWLQHHQKN